MEFKIYRSDSNYNVVDKTDLLSEIKTVDGVLKDSVNIHSPTIILKFDKILLEANYIYIPDFNRYYFIDNITIDKKVLIFDLSVDVLMSFKNDILNASGLIVRSEQGNVYIPDSNLLKEVRKESDLYYSDVVIEDPKENILMIVTN